MTPKYVGANRMDILIEVDGEDDVQRLAPNFDALVGLVLFFCFLFLSALLKTFGVKSKIKTRCVIVTSRPKDPKLDFVSRVFAPAVGIVEDPV